MNWYLEVLKKYAVFSGRARRKEYWYYGIITSIILLLLAAIGGVIEKQGALAGIASLFIPRHASTPVLADLYLLATALPSLAVAVRRLHDTGRSGWWFFISFIPIIGFIVMLVFTLMDSEPGENEYGANPKNAAANEDLSGATL